MSALPAPSTLNPEDALALVEPERRGFAVLLAEGKTGMQELAGLNGLALSSAYRWAKDGTIVAYVDAVGRDSGLRAKRQLRQHIDAALGTLVRIMGDDLAPHAAQLKAATEILDRAGVTKEELTRSGQGGGDTVVQVNILNPVNPDAQDEQRERARRKREHMATIEAQFTEPHGSD